MKLFFVIHWGCKKNLTFFRHPPALRRPKPRMGAGSVTRNTTSQNLYYSWSTLKGRAGLKNEGATQYTFPPIGINNKVVERTRATLRSQFPVSGLWDGARCGRGDWITCEQGAEDIPNCTRSSVVYENVCKRCNLWAGEQGELKNVRFDIPTLCIGK